MLDRSFLLDDLLTKQGGGGGGNKKPATVQDKIVIQCFLAVYRQYPIKYIYKKINCTPLQSMTGICMFDICQTYYLVKEVLNHNSGSDVIPVTMYQEHSPEKLKPGHSIVTCSDCLSALLTHHTDTNMSLLNHTTVISTVTYSQSHWLFIGTLHQLDNLQTKQLTVMSAKDTETHQALIWTSTFTFHTHSGKMFPNVINLQWHCVANKEAV